MVESRSLWNRMGFVSGHFSLFFEGRQKGRCKFSIIMHHTRRYRAGEGLAGACLNAEHAQYYHYKISLPVS